MKILFITEFFPDLNLLNFSGGVETRTYFIAKNLSKKHKVIILSRRKKGEKKAEEIGNLKIYRLGKEILNIEAKFSSVFSRFNFIIQSFIYSFKIKADLVEGSNFVSFPSAWFIGLIKNIPKIAWYPDLLGNEWFKNFDFLTGLTGLISENIGLLFPWSRVIALSQETKKKLLKAGINKGKIDVIYGGVDFHFSRQINKKFERPTICTISRLVPYKNIDCLIKAISMVKQKIKNISLIIIGKGPEEMKLKKLVQDLRIVENVQFKKDLTYKNLLSILSKSKIFSLPSEIEGFGLATIEAVGLGVPYIISDIPINHEVTKGKGGLFFIKNNTEDLSKKIIKLTEDKDLYSKLKKETRELVSSYSWQEISRQTELVYEKAIKGEK